MRVIIDLASYPYLPFLDSFLQSGNAQMPSVSLHNYKVDLKSGGCLYFHVIIKLSSSPKRLTIHFRRKLFQSLALDTPRA